VDSPLYLIGYVAIDIIRLDAWIARRNPDYQEDESIQDFIAWWYGDEAAQYVEHWIAGTPVTEEKAA
jgi:protoporphyrinogen oxidase